MALPKTQQQREYLNFGDNGDGTTSRFVSIKGGNQFQVPELADAFTRECIGNTVVYKFRQGGLSGSILKTITLYYTSPQDPTFTGGSL